MQTLDVVWNVLSKGADIVGFISLGISVITLVNTRKIRSSMLAHVETSEYRQAIDEQIGELDAFQTLLVKEENLDSSIFLKLMANLRNIGISYETILPAKLTKKIANLNEHIKKNFYDSPSQYTKKDLEKCVSMLVYIISELKKEKKVL